MSGEPKNILVVCGTSVATSTVVREKLKEELPKHGVNVGNITKAKATEGGSKASSGNFDIVVSTTSIDESRYDIPVIHTTAFMTGLNEDEAIEDIVEALNNT